MILVKFIKEGYAFSDVCHADNAFDYTDTRHDMLFSYIEKDLSRLPALLRRYMAKAMNLSTFELTGDHLTEKDSAEIDEILVDAHMYYKLDLKYNNHGALVKAVGYYFNALLLQKTYQKKEGLYFFDPVYDIKWYSERFAALAKPYLCDNNAELYERYYKFYKRRVGKNLPSDIDKMNILELFNDTSAVASEEKGFDAEIMTQMFIKRMLFLIMDVSPKFMAKMTPQQRMWVYSNVYGAALFQEYEMVVKKRLSFSISYAKKMEEMDCDQIDSMFTKNYMYRNLFEQIYDLYSNQGELSIEDEESALQCAKLLMKDMPNLPRYHSEEYEITDLLQLLFLEVTQMIDQGVTIRRCRSCGMYFVITNRNQRYCHRVPAGFDQPCTEIGPALAFQKKKEEDPALTMYLKAYNTHRMRVKNRIMKPEDLAPWAKKAKEKLEKVRSGELDQEAFAKWLKY